MIRSTTCLAAFATLVTLSLVDTALAQVSFSLGDAGGNSFSMNLGGGNSGVVGGGRRMRGGPRFGVVMPVATVQQPIVTVGRRGRIRSNPVVIGGGQPIGFAGSGWQPVGRPAPISRVLPMPAGGFQTVGMPTRGGGLMPQPAFGGGSRTITHTHQNHTGTHTVTKTIHANGTASIQRSSVGVPVQAFALMP